MSEGVALRIVDILSDGSNTLRFIKFLQQLCKPLWQVIVRGKLMP